MTIICILLTTKQDYPSNFDMDHDSRQRLLKQSNNNISWDESTSELEAYKLILIVDLNRSVHSNNDVRRRYYQEGENHMNTSHNFKKIIKKQDNDVLWDELDDAINKGCMKSLLDVTLQVIHKLFRMELHKLVGQII